MEVNGGRAGGGLGHGGIDEHRMLYQDSRATGSALSGLSQKQGQIYKERKYRFRGMLSKQYLLTPIIYLCCEVRFNLFLISFYCSVPEFLRRRTNDLCDRVLQALQTVQDISDGDHLRRPQEDCAEEQGVLAPPPEIRSHGLRAATHQRRR